MKFALFFILSLVALQGSQARSVEEVRSVEPLAKDSLRSILGDILEAISRLLEAINNITTVISAIVESISSRIQEVLERIQQIVQEINNTIENIIVQGEIARQCVQAEREQINALINFTHEGSQECIRQALAETDNLQDQIRVLLSRAEALRDDISDRVTECLEENSNPGAVASCLAEQVEPVQAQLNLLLAEIRFTIRVARETAVDVANALTECSTTLQQEIAIRREQLVTDIRQCIDANQPPQEV